MTRSSTPPGADDRTAAPSRRRCAVVAPFVALALVVGLGACRGGSEDEPEPGASRAGTATADLATVVSLGRVTGDLDRDRGPVVRDAVAAVVGRWLDAAYVGGDWPRRGVEGAYPGFTRGAADQARADRVLTSNALLGPRLDDVVARRSAVTVDVLATGGRPRAATARFVLAMRLSGKVDRDERVSGRLYLTPGEKGWQVIGYDVRRGVERGSGR